MKWGSQGERLAFRELSRARQTIVGTAGVTKQIGQTDRASIADTVKEGGDLTVLWE